jgi:uncharacterized protein
MTASAHRIALSITQTIAAEIAAQPRQVQAAIGLLDEGATVPFIARYRKEVTDGLDDTQLRKLEERLGYLRELEDRRGAVLESIRGQNKLSDELESKINSAVTKAELEDLYLPYKPKRRTRGEIAREKGKCCSPIAAWCRRKRLRHSSPNRSLIPRPRSKARVTS